MTSILIVRDVLAADGSRLPTQGMFIDSADLAKYQAYGYRLPLGAPAIPATESQYDGFDKSPTDIRDWTFDWSEMLLPGEIITASLWITTAGLTLSAPATPFTNTTASVVVSGGTLGITYLVTNRVTTNASPPEQLDWSFTVTIAQE